MIFSNPLTKLKRLASKNRSIARIKTEQKIAKDPLVLTLVKGVIPLLVLVIVSVMIYFAAPNIKAINEFKPKSYDETNTVTLDRVNILFVIKENQNGYELLKGLDLISYEKSTKNITVRAINTKTIIQDSSLGKNVYVENIYQLNKLANGDNGTLLKYFSELFAVKLDYYLVTPIDYFKDSLKVTGPVIFYNDYEANAFKKGNVSINSDNLSSFWESVFGNDGQRLVSQNKFLQAYFSKLGSVESFYNYVKLSDLSNKYIDTNFTLDFYREFFKDTLFNSNKINFGFSPTQLFLITPDGKYFDKDKFDEYIKSEFSDTKIQREQARVEVQNASGTGGLASRVARFVSNSGAEVSRVGNFGIEVPKTTVYVKDQNKFAQTVSFLENLLKNTEFRFESPEKLSTADILIIVKDF